MIRSLLHSIFSKESQFPTTSNSIRVTPSFHALVTLTVDSEHILHDQDLLFCHAFNKEKHRGARKFKHVPTQTLDQAFASLDCEHPPSSPTSRARSTSATVKTGLDSYLQTCKHYWQIVLKEENCKHAKRLQEATRQAVKTVFSDIFFTNHTEAGKELANSSFRLTETVLTNMAKKGTLDNAFNHIIEWWTQSTTLTNALAARTLL